MANKQQITPKIRMYYVGLVILLAGLSWIALILPLREQFNLSVLEVGQVAAQDYLSPGSMTFVSEVLTEQKRQDTANTVLPVYTASDTNVARRQSERLRAALAYISTVREDDFASLAQKLSDLSFMDDLSLDQRMLQDILQLSDARWQAVSQEANVTLERVMTSTIRPEDLEQARQRAPNLVSLSLSESEAAIAAELASALIAPNSFYSAELTEAAQQAAQESVAPVSRSYIAGQTVVRRGQLLTRADIEALEQLGLIEAPLGWQFPVSAAGLVLLMTVFMIVYFSRDRSLLGKPRRLTLIAFLFLLFLYAARLIIPFHVVLPYAFPLAAYSLTIVALFGPQLAMITSLPLAVMTAFALPSALDLTLFYLVGSLLGVLSLGGARRVAAFFWAGSAVAITGGLVVVAYRLYLPTTDWLGVATLAGVSVFNGLATASLTILLQFSLAQVLGTTTPMQLMDLTRPDHPLLQKLLREAPGTYQHSLQVANLAEQAAERIGADPLLTRVGALYHDAGKSVNPFYFIENQVPGLENPHENLDPVTSARAIIQHVADGVKLAQKEHLPRRVIDFINEHHGTMITLYQYVSAVKQAGGDESKVSKSDFRYTGPRPQSRETAILMLADGCEARVRAERPKEEAEMRTLIKSIIDDRVASGQLDDTSLTLQDINLIVESFTATLRGIYHPRLVYPQLKEAEPPRLALTDVATRPVSYSGSQSLERLPEEISEKLPETAPAEKTTPRN